MFLGFTGLCVWAINECERNLENSQSLHLKCLLSFSEDVSHLQVHTMLLLFNRDEGKKWRKKSFHWFWALSKTIPICHTCCHYGRRCQSVKHFSMVVDIVDTIWKRSQTGAFCFLYASIPSKDLFDAILLYCYTIDCFWWVWSSWWFMHQNSNSKSRCTLCKNLLIGRVLYVSQKSGYHLREGLLHICCLWWVPVVLVCWVWIWDLERGPPLGQSVAFFACISAQSFIPKFPFISR